MPRIAVYINLSIIFTFLLSSCGNRFDVDLSDIPSNEVEIIRYEKALFEANINEKNLDELQNEFPLFLGNVPLDSIQTLQLQAYVNDPLLKKLYAKTKATYPTLNNEEAELASAFRYIKYYFPQFKSPKVYTYLSGVQDMVFYQDQIIMVSIDNYLGDGYEVYQQMGKPRYKQYGMQKQFIVKDILMNIAKGFIPPIPPDAQLLEQMIYEGKLIYFIKSMYPSINDEILLTQTTEHIAWLNRKESDLWRYYIENELLYQSDYIAANKFINDAPFTAVLGDDSAPRTGIWLGYQIVSTYMENTENKLKKLISNSNAQRILQQSKYKP